jgi:ATP-binding cassette, subfamily C (CFTR/MRP), member 1
MSTDVGRVDFAAGWVHMGWVAIVQVSIMLTILLINIGPSALAGFGLLVVAGPILGKAVRTLHTKRRKSTKFTDARVRLIQEILSSMRAIKVYTWEKSFLGRVYDIRLSELKIVRYLLMLKTAINAVSMCIPVYASILAFMTYSLTGNTLNPANVFSSLTLFNMLRMPLMFLPRVISASIDAWVALGRIQRLLMADEINKPLIDYKSEFAISMDKGRFIWEVENVVEKTNVKRKRKWWERRENRKSPTNADKKIVEEQKSPAELGGVRTFNVTDKEKHEPNMSVSTHVEFRSSEVVDTASLSTVESATDRDHLPPTIGISFNINQGEFVVVVGEIGSGKSSLLAAVVGEMRRTKGLVKLGGSVGFCPQIPWIQNDTLKNNILFGEAFDQVKYDQVIRDCALEPDLEMLPNGDRTEIGERGVTLSGGQKARVNLARAAYNDADIYLLDDPLSAVDAHVGHHLLEKCICGLMAGKTRILVTHQLHVLAKADRIFCMREGVIVEQGTYKELLSDKGNFARLIDKFCGNDETKKENEDETKPVEISKDKKKKSRRDKGLMMLEERATGSVAWAVYKEYINAAGGIWVIPAVIGSVILANAVNITTSYWLSSWTSDKYHLPRSTYVAVYATLGFSQAIFIFLFGYILTVVGNRATEKFHEKVLLIET